MRSNGSDWDFVKCPTHRVGLPSSGSDVYPSHVVSLARVVCTRWTELELEEQVNIKLSHGKKVVLRQDQNLGKEGSAQAVVA